MKRAVVLVTVLALPALAAGGWPRWSPVFSEHPCQDGWLSCLGPGGPNGPGTTRDTAGRPLPSDLRVGWFDLSPTPAFSPFVRLSAYREPSMAADQILAESTPPIAPPEATPSPVEPIATAPTTVAPTIGTNAEPRVPPATGNPRTAASTDATRINTPVNVPIAAVPPATTTGTGRAPPVSSPSVGSPSVLSPTATSPTASNATGSTSTAANPTAGSARVTTTTPPPTTTGMTRPPDTTSATATMRVTTPTSSPATTVVSAPVVAATPVVTPTAVIEPARVTPATCTDLVALESVALMGQLSAGQRQCLDARIGVESAQTTKDKVSRVLIADAFARGDTGEWERLVRRHLEDINRSDPDLCYKYALQISRGGVGRASGVIRWADYAMENKQKWSGAMYTSRVNALLKLRAEASAKLWQAAEQEYTTGAHTDENEAKAARLRGQAKDYAKEWLDYARASSQDTKTALALCVSAAGNRQFCEGG